MPFAVRLAAMLETVKPAELAALPPEERRHFADVCRRLAREAEADGGDLPTGRHFPRSGILDELNSGLRGD